MFNQSTPANDPPGSISMVLELQERDIEIAMLHAQQVVSTVTIFNFYLSLWNGHEIAWRQTIAELRCALHLTFGQARREVDLACALSQRLPAALEELTSGSLDKARARIIVDGTIHLPDVAAESVCETVLAKAPQLTTRQLRDWIRKLCVTVNPSDALDRYEAEHGDRALSIELTSEGTATIIASGLEPGRAMATFNKVRHMAIAAKATDDPRSHANVRADVFLDLLDGTTTSARSSGGGAHIVTDLTTLMGLNQQAINIQGLGPVVADIGRQAVAAGATRKGNRWTFSITDHANKAVTGITRRRPTAAIKQEVQARELTCIFPGCDRPSVDCDLDHRIRYADGGTTHANQLVPLCRPDHVDRHRGWDHIQDDEGNHMWISPTQMTYITIRAP